MQKKISLSLERKEEMRRKVVDYFGNERDEELGELASQLILDFFIEELGADLYNQGIEDANIYLRDKLDDLFALQIKRR